MSVRKELLERELRKLGFRKAEAHGSHGGHDGAVAQQQQQQQPASSHPQAGGAVPGGTEHGD